MKLINGYYYDASNNRWDASIFSEHEAMNMALTLFCCRDCTNCMNLVRCENCFGLSNCEHCRDCTYCLFSNFLTKCGNCYGCDCLDKCGPMLNCKYCFRSAFLTNCKSCWNCMHLENEVEIVNKANFQKEEPLFIQEAMNKWINHLTVEKFRNWYIGQCC